MAEYKKQEAGSGLQTTAVNLEIMPRADALDVFDGMETQVKTLLGAAAAINVTDVTQEEEMQKARQCRLSLRTLRADVERRRKELGEEALRRKQTIDKMARKIRGMIEPEEARLLECEKFKERMELAYLEDIRIQRSEQLAPYGDPALYSVERMTQEAFDKLLHGLRLAHEARIEEERLAAKAAEERAKVEEEERKRIRQENAKLKAEADARNAELAKEREEAARQQKLKEQALREVARQKAEAEAKIQAELRAKEEEKRKAAAAPDVEKLRAFSEQLKQITIPPMTSVQGKKVAVEVQEEVACFCAWLEKRAEEME